MRVHGAHVKNGELQPGVFRDQGDGMSTDWSKYSTPEQTRDRAANPAQNGVVALLVQPLRDVPLEVAHTPDVPRNNRAHTDVRGKKTAEVRAKLMDVFEWRIKVGA